LIVSAETKVFSRKELSVANILVVDDDPHISEVVEFALSAAGHQVRTAFEAETALDVFKAEEADLLILDVSLPGKDGLWLCRSIREFSQVPIIFLSAKDEEVDRVMGLTIGGDDYVTKPFSPRELTARVAAVLRRNPASAGGGSPAPEGEEQTLKRGLLTLDMESVEAFYDGRKVELTPTEFKILKSLCQRPRKVFTRNELLELAFPGVAVSDRTIDSHILHIRKKFNRSGAKEIIQTQHGLGYSLAQL
jgi:two-component system OmpR family response regulator